MGSELLLTGAYVASFVAAASLTYLVMVARGEGEIVTSGTAREQKVESPLLAFLLRFARALAPLFSGTADTPRGRETDRMLRKAGRPLGLTVPELHALRIVGGLFGAFFGWFGSVAVYDEPSLGLILFMGAFGAYYPGYSVKRTMEQRRIRIFRDLPYVLEMLMLSTEAGQDFSSAMATVIEKGTPGPLLEEFRVVHQEVTLGKTRADALRAMAQRIDLPEVTSFVLALIQAEQLGTSIGNVLRIMAEQMRVKRSTIAEELAGKVPVKLMAPLVVCILPASFIVLLFGPIYMYMTGQELG